MTGERLGENDEERQPQPTESTDHAKAVLRRDRFAKALFHKEYGELTPEEKEKVDVAIKKANSSLRSVH